MVSRFLSEPESYIFFFRKKYHVSFYRYNNYLSHGYYFYKIKKIAIIGGGAASFVAADVLSKSHQVTIYEKGKSIGRKYLVAGKGGFNISHNLEYGSLIKKYQPDGFLDSALHSFDVKDLRAWYANMGIETFVGSSNRIFPIKGVSPADVLRSIKSKLNKQGVIVKTEHEFIGFENHSSPSPLLVHKGCTFTLKSDIFIFALGGSSWKVTGSEGNWLTHFEDIGIKTLPFQASNCGLNIQWPESISKHHVGKPLKNISITHLATTVKGEALISDYGLEGNAIYPISRTVGNSLHHEPNNTTVSIDLKPSLSLLDVQHKLSRVKTNEIRKALHLDSSQFSLLKAFSTKAQFQNPYQLSKLIKNLPIPVLSLRPIEEAISTTGGIDTNELTTDFSLKKHPHMYAIGEMVDWDAPTGGFLLQGCFSMGCYVGNKIL